MTGSPWPGRSPHVPLFEEIGWGESGVLRMEEVLTIHDLHRQGLSIQAIARRAGLDRKTVRKYLARGLEPPVYGPRAPRGSILEPYHDYLRGRVRAYPELSGARLLREIRALGYRGGYTIVTDYLREVRPAPMPGFEHRFETPPGEQAQVDFAHFKVVFTDEPTLVRVVWLFSLVLGHSRHLFGRFVLRQTVEEVVRCHLAAFGALGGVPRQILYDRLKAAVIDEDDEGRVIFNRTLVDLASHYGFTPKACRPYRAKTKGKVERPFRYIRQDFFLGRSFRNLDDLNAQLDDWLDQVANVRVHGTTGRRVDEAFAAEQPHLQPLPALPFRSLLRLERRITRDGMISIDGNLYSVPDGTRRRVVEVQTLPEELRIYEDGRLIAVHAPVAGRGQRVLAVGHRHRPPPGRDPLPAGPEVALKRPGDTVPERPLAIYTTVGQALARAGERRP
jgi:transposase